MMTALVSIVNLSKLWQMKPYLSLFLTLQRDGAVLMDQPNNVVQTHTCSSPVHSTQSHATFASCCSPLVPICVPRMGDPQCWGETVLNNMFVGYHRPTHGTIDISPAPCDTITMKLLQRGMRVLFFLKNMSKYQIPKIQIAFYMNIFRFFWTWESKCTVVNWGDSKHLSLLGNINLKKTKCEFIKLSSVFEHTRSLH